MKKIWNILMVLLLMASSMSIVIADEEDADDDVEIDEDTEKEIEVMDIKEGAQVRLLQLELSITNSLLNGYLIVNTLNEVFSDEVDTSDLENILYELEAVLEDVQNADPSDENAVQYFVEYKQDAIDLVKSWRENATALKQSLTGADDWNSFVVLVNEGIEEIPDNEDLVALKKEFRELVNIHNSKRLEIIAEYLGEDLDELINKLKNGEITRKELREYMKEIISEMSPEERQEFFKELKTGRLRMQIRARHFINDIEPGYHQRKMQRNNRRLQNIINIKNRRKGSP
jgi:hypothetical protein